MFSDFSTQWYEIVGRSIVIVMIICAISPYIEIAVEYLIFKIYRTIFGTCVPDGE
jgi:hypothetical protein